MTASRRLGTALPALVAALVLGQPGAVRADVDMTAVWHVVVTGFPAHIMTFETFEQTGTTLAMSHPDDPPSFVPGTIDPITGAFHLEFGQATQEGVTEPGPGIVRVGTVAPDGLSFSARQNACIWDGGWGCIMLTVSGSRTDIVCGDGVREGDEECDLGADNGGPCCATTCGWVDPDQDDVCTPEDNCPDVQNDQRDYDEDGLGNACDATPNGEPSDPLELRALKLATRPDANTSTLKLNGATTGVLGEPTFLGLVDAGGKEVIVSDLPGWATKVCSQKAGLRLKCKSQDGLVLTLSAKASAPTSLLLKLATKRAPVGPPFTAPVTFTMLLADGAHTGVVSSCKTSSAGSISCKP